MKKIHSLSFENAHQLMFYTSSVRPLSSIWEKLNQISNRKLILELNLYTKEEHITFLMSSLCFKMLLNHTI
jgi:hypothetical protein